MVLTVVTTPDGMGPRSPRAAPRSAGSCASAALRSFPLPEGLPPTDRRVQGPAVSIPGAAPTHGNGSSPYARWAPTSAATSWSCRWTRSSASTTPHVSAARTRRCWAGPDLGLRSYARSPLHRHPDRQQRDQRRARQRRDGEQHAVLPMQHRRYQVAPAQRPALPDREQRDGDSDRDQPGQRQRPRVRRGAQPQRTHPKHVGQVRDRQSQRGGVDQAHHSHRARQRTQPQPVRPRPVGPGSAAPPWCPG